MSERIYFIDNIQKLPTGEWRFKGDVDGYFAKYSSNPEKESVEEYIKYCKEQIKLAERYLKEDVTAR